MFRKKIASIFYFVLTTVLVIVVLKIIGWLPLAIQQDTLRRYGSIEEVRSKLRIGKVYVPSYFPQSVQWPPSEILAQKSPFPAVAMEFKNIDNGDIALVISQAAGKGFVLHEKIKIISVNEKVTYPLKGRSAVLEVGFCENRIPCSRISWEEERYRIRVFMRSTPFDMVKIAESMLP